MSTEKCNFSREKSETNDVYQLICSDTGHSQVRLYGKLNWDSRSSEEVVSGIFKLVNTKKSPGYVLSNVDWCEELKRLEFHITVDKDNTQREQIYYRTFQKSFELKGKEELKLIWRVNNNTNDPFKKLCKVDLSDDTPDDKDGSIIVGERP